MTDPIREQVRQFEHDLWYGTPPSNEPPSIRATCCQYGGEIEWDGPVNQQSWGSTGGWNLYGPDMNWAGPLNFCPWCGARLPEEPV